MEMAMEITWIVGFGVNIDHDEPLENDVLPGVTARQRQSETSTVEQNQVKSLIIIMVMIDCDADEGNHEDKGDDYHGADDGEDDG